MNDNENKPSRRSALLDYQAPVALGDRMRRRLPSGDQIVDFLKTLVWVAPLTLLIWIYAERAGTVSQPGIIFPVEVRTTDPNRIVTLRRPPDRNIIVELSGPRANLDKLVSELQAKPGSPAIEISVDPRIGLGGQELLTVGQINNLQIFKNSGISVKSAQPPYLFVDIDEYQERDVPVKASPEIANQLSEETFVPATVRIRAPSQLMKRAEADHQLFVTADLSKREELKTRTGAVKLENIPLTWIYKENVFISPTLVTANLVIKQSDAQFTIASVPIFNETPAGLNDNFKVQYTNSIPNVTVTGPGEQLELIRKGDFKVKARMEITSLDPPNKPIKRRLQFDLPPNVTLSPETAARAEWEFRLIER